jgi:hypothetical protein
VEDIAVANYAVPTYNPPRLPGFRISNLSTLEFARGFTFWHYRAVTETLEMLVAPGYFDAAQDMFKLGDYVIISSSSWGTTGFITAVHPHIVLSPALPLPVPS